MATTSIDYEDIYSRFFTKVEAYDLITTSMRDEMVQEFMCNWLHSSLFNPYIRKLFSTLSANDDKEEILYEYSYKIDDEYDKDFLLEVVSYGMLYAWINPKINSVSNISQMFGSTDEKWYSQAMHLSELRNLREDIEIKLRSLIRDRGYLNNDYLDGMAASASMRG